MSENIKTKKNGGNINDKRILPLCRWAKNQSKRADIQSLLARKRTWKIFRAGGQEKPLALFSSLNHDGNFEDNLEDKNVDVEKVVATQMMIEALKSALSKLNRDEREIIERLYFNDETLRAVAKTKNISHPTLIKRRDKILEKLKKFIEEI